MTSTVIPSKVSLFASFTDFGVGGPYTGQLQAVLISAAPGIPFVDLLATAPSFRPRPSAYLLAALARGLPKGALVLGIVDPGVGGDREIVIVEADERIYVGPDNGLFAIVAKRAPRAKMWRVTWRPTYLSASFHGRDWIAPLAARMANGDWPDSQAGVCSDLVGANWPDAAGEIIYVDGYGNLMTGLEAASCPITATVCIGSRRLGYARTFSAAPEGTAFWYESSCGLVEIAVNRRRADRSLRQHIGAKVWVELPRDTS